MTKYVCVYGHDIKQDVCIFRQEDERGHLVFRPMYKDLACPKCGKIDELKALQRGIDQEITFQIKRDLFGSVEHLYIVSDPVRMVLDSFPDSNVDYYEFPSVPGYYVSMPRKMIYPTFDSGSFQSVAGVCPECGRHREVIWGSVLPTIKKDFAVGVFFLERRCGIGCAMVVAEYVAQALKSTRPRLKGLFVDRKVIG